MGERSLQHGKNLRICFVDYEGVLKGRLEKDDVDAERYWSGLEG